MNDKNTNEDKTNLINFNNTLNYACKKLGIEGYTVTDTNGYYIYSNGNICNEKSKEVLFIGINEKDISPLVEFLKVELNQECIMIEYIKSEFKFV